MENVIYTILIAGGTGFVTAFVQWYFYKREHRAKADKMESLAVKSEIEVYQIMLKDLKEAAEEWRKSAEENRGKLLDERKRVDELLTIKRDLKRAMAKINDLEKHTNGNGK